MEGGKDEKIIEIAIDVRGRRKTKAPHILGTLVFHYLNPNYYISTVYKCPLYVLVLTLILMSMFLNWVHDRKMHFEIGYLTIPDLCSIFLSYCSKVQF